MTKSELHAVMSAGFATVAGSTMAAYILFGVIVFQNSNLNLSWVFENMWIKFLYKKKQQSNFAWLKVPAEHLLCATVMNAPGALAVAKLLYPETKKSTVKDQEVNLNDTGLVQFSFCIW